MRFGDILVILGPEPKKMPPLSATVLALLVTLGTVHAFAFGSSGGEYSNEVDWSSKVQDTVISPLPD